MSTAGKIREYIAKLAPGEMFCTRDVLSLGTRGSIDQALHLSVKNKIIIRLTYGLFCKPGGESTLSVRQVAERKAQAFGRSLMTHVGDCAQFLGGPASSIQRFSISCTTSKLRIQGQEVQLIKACQRKIKLGESTSGQAIQGLWRLGRRAAVPQVIAKVVDVLGPDFRRIAMRLRTTIPDWIYTKLTTFRAAEPAAQAVKLPL